MRFYLQAERLSRTIREQRSSDECFDHRRFGASAEFVATGDSSTGGLDVSEAVVAQQDAAANPAVRFQFFHKVQIGRRPSRRVAELESLGD